MSDLALSSLAGREVRLGKKEAQHKAKNLRLARYLDVERLALTAPSQTHYGQKVGREGGTFPMYGNDRLGDCTCAAAGHHIEVWSAWGAGLSTPSEDEILKAYIPGTGSVDDGRYLNEVLDYWRTEGIAGNKIEAYASVDVKNIDEVKLAHWLFGGLYIGVGLPVTAQRQKVWHVDAKAPTSDRQPYSWGGHCVDTTGYANTMGMYFVTWGELTRMTWAFWKAYVDEAFAILDASWLNADKSPDVAGALDLATLSADLASIGG